MYRKHFDLELFPFKMTPDPAFICWNSQHRRAASVFEFGFAQLSPISILTGDVGAGKTTLLLHFLNKKSDGLTVGLISNFLSGLGSLYTWVLNAYGIDPEPNDVDRFEAFQRFILSEYSVGRRCLLIVDEAQNLSDEDLEQLRMLTNINSGKDVVLMVFLVGQPQLRASIERSSNRQIAQRIGSSFNLGPMDLSDTRSYVRHRITVAGGVDDIFDNEAIALIYKRTGGVPRLINLVCEMALVSAYGEQVKRIDGTTMESFLDDAEQNGILACLPEVATDPALPARPGTTPIEALFFNEPHVHSSAPPDHIGVVEATDEPSPPVEKLVQPRELSAADESSNTSSARPPVAEGDDLQRTVEPLKTKSSSKLRLLTGTAVAGVAIFAVTSVPHVERQTVEMANVAVQPTNTIETPLAQKELPVILPEAIVPFGNITGTELLENAIEIGVTDPRAAAVAYARAALRGEHKAAYSLGQLYETGHGVPRDLTQARAWYTTAQDSVRGARRRLANLGEPEKTGEMSAPILHLGGPIAGGGAEFVWTSGEGANPDYFVVEISDGKGGPFTRLAPTEPSAFRIDSIGDARIWRVFAVDADRGLYTVSEWMPLGDLQDPTSLGFGAVDPNVIVTVPPDLDPALLAVVTEPLEAANFPLNKKEGAVELSAVPQVNYYFDADKDTALKVADLLGASPEILSDVPFDPAIFQPLPGQITIIPAAR